jgi:hypothetical protein
MPEVLQEILRVGFEAKGPLRVGRVVVGASVSGALASSEEQLAELREGSAARGPWLEEQQAWAGKLLGGVGPEAGDPAVVVLVVEQLPAVLPGLGAAQGSQNLLPGKHLHSRQSNTARCLCNPHRPDQHSSSLRFGPDTVLGAAILAVMLDMRPGLELGLEVGLEQQLQQG